MNRHSKKMNPLKWMTMVATGLVLLSACSGNQDKDDPNGKKGSQPEFSDSELKAQLDSLQSQMTIAWDSMMRADDLKMKYILRYIDEVAYIPGSDESAVAELKNMYQTVDQMDYQMNNFPSDAIDRFDSIQTELIKQTFKVGTNTPGNENYPLLTELTQDISLLDNQLIVNRGNYDEFSIPYNCILINQAEQVKALGEPYSSMKQVAVFMLKPSCEPMEVIEADSVQEWMDENGEETTM